MIFLNAANSAAALVFYLPGVCTHTDIEGKQRKARVRSILIFENNTRFNEHPVALSSIRRHLCNKHLSSLPHILGPSCHTCSMFANICEFIGRSMWIFQQKLDCIQTAFGNWFMSLNSQRVSKTLQWLVSIRLTGPTNSLSRLSWWGSLSWE